MYIPDGWSPAADGRKWLAYCCNVDGDTPRERSLSDVIGPIVSPGSENDDDPLMCPRAPDDNWLNILDRSNVLKSTRPSIGDFFTRLGLQHRF